MSYNFGKISNSEIKSIKHAFKIINENNSDLKVERILIEDSCIKIANVPYEKIYKLHDTIFIQVIYSPFECNDLGFVQKKITLKLNKIISNPDSTQVFLINGIVNQ